MKKGLFIFFLATTQVVYSQVTTKIAWQKHASVEKGDTVFYDPSRKLKWDDFKGPPDNRSIAAAVTSSGFGYAMSMRSVNNTMVIDIGVYCFYNKNTSWVKPGMASDYALVHEQHHFDITYLVACSFLKKLREAVLTRENFSGQVENLYNECYGDLDSRQEEYDRDTNHGRLKNKQGEWNLRIDQELLAGFKG
jgi:hypothetical protein